MEARLNLIKNDFEQVERRVLPRFPYCYMTFRAHLPEGPNDRVYEVKEISYSGMQLCLKNGISCFHANSKMEGELHWKGQNLPIQGIVKWVKDNKIGVHFDISNFGPELLRFLSLDNLVRGLQPMHSHPMTELPQGLRYWLRGDGPVEIFIWALPDGETEKFQIVLLENFIEWQAGVGAQTGKVMTLRDLDTPLVTEDEFIFRWDKTVDLRRLELAYQLVQKIPQTFWHSDIQEFVLYKLK